MGGLLREASREATKTVRTIDHHSEQSFGSIFSDVARLLWPELTAPNVASAVGCSVRVAEMYLAGDRKWSGDAIAVVVAEIMRRHGARNIKVIGNS